jgi:hypothetical protein
MQTVTIRDTYREVDRKDASPGVPPVPESLQDTGLTAAFVTDLLVKALYTYGAQSGGGLSDLIRLPFNILDECLPTLQRRRLAEVQGTEGHGRRSYVFDLTGEGRTRARELMETNAYVGPAPVPSEVYRWWVARQSVRSDPIPEARIREGLAHLVLDEAFLNRLGPGLNSGRSVFLFGPPGNGKTEIAFSVTEIMGSAIYIPYAVVIDGQVIQVYDPHVHIPARDGRGESVDFGPVDADLLRDVPDHDPRFVRVRRPGVVVGGELTLDELDLQKSPRKGVFVAPPHMKANGGVFVLDDFGRQRVRPRDLLNRWMIPLDRGTDYLGLPTGHKLEVPFDCLVFFATNLNPSDLVEEAFLRRIRHKIFIPNPTRDQFTEILRRVCRSREVAYSDRAVGLIFDEFYEGGGIEPRSCHPRDIVADLCDHARYLGIEPSLEGELLRHACRSYFIDMPKLDQAAAHHMTGGRKP